MWQELHKRLASKGVEVFAAQPGVADTEFMNKTDANVTKPLGTAVVRRTEAISKRIFFLVAACTNSRPERPREEMCIGPHRDMSSNPPGVAVTINFYPLQPAPHVPAAPQRHFPSRYPQRCCLRCRKWRDL